jgi:hypothetical protein
MEEHQKHGKVGKAGLRSGMHRNTAGKYLKAGKLPSSMKKPRDWRTRPDPFAEDWPGIVDRLELAPELEAKALFEDLVRRKPERGYQEGQLRTLQRRIKQWRAQHGPPKEVFFAQEHRPGEAMQTDFTSANKLRITIGGEPFEHLLCHNVLPYSNWEWATVCFSESLVALRRGVQSAVFRLGRRAQWHQTDHSTAATHEVKAGDRGFNAEYEALMRHLGMKPRTTAVGAKEQNGDVEALNGALKRRLEQHLLLRGSRDFESRAAYEQWLWEILDKANRLRQRRLSEELEQMKPLRVQRLAEFTEEKVRVTAWSTIRVKFNTYSVPSRLIREWVQVRVYEDHLEVYYGGQRQLEVERLRGRGGRRINYRHIIWWLVKKPGAFAHYRYREELFPTVTFRRAYDRLRERRVERTADVAYLRILHLAASTMESEVEAALERLLGEGRLPLYERVRSVVDRSKPEVPEVAAFEVDLTVYDGLLGEVAS